MDDDVAALVADACRRDPSLPSETAELLVRVALAGPVNDAPSVARHLLDSQADLDASWANAVATAVVGEPAS